MTIKTTGQLKFSEIEAEFKQGANPIKLSEYYRGGPEVPDGPTANANIAKTGQQQLHNYYGATEDVSDPVKDAIAGHSMGFYYFAGNNSHGNVIHDGIDSTDNRGDGGFGTSPYVTPSGFGGNTKASGTDYLDTIKEQSNLAPDIVWPPALAADLAKAGGKPPPIFRYASNPASLYRYVYKEENASRGIGYWTGMTGLNNSTHVYPTVNFPTFSFKPKRDGWWIMVYASIHIEELQKIAIGDAAAGFLLFNMRTASRNFASSIVISPDKSVLQVTFGKYRPGAAYPRWDLFRVAPVPATISKYYPKPPSYKETGWLPFIVCVSNELFADPTRYGGERVHRRTKAWVDRDVVGTEVPGRLYQPWPEIKAGQIPAPSFSPNLSTDWGNDAQGFTSAEGWGDGGISTKITDKWDQPFTNVNMILEAGQIPSSVRIYATAGAEGIMDQALFTKLSSAWKTKWGH